MHNDTKVNMEPNVTTITLAAKEKQCSRQAVYNAISRGELTVIQLGGNRMIAKDAKYRRFNIKETGGRLHADYLAKRKD